MAKQSTPSAVSSVEGVRKAMGISLDPLPTVETNNSMAPQPSMSMEPDQRDIESELSKLLGEDEVSEVMTDIFQ